VKRTNVYLEDEQLRALKHIAIEEGVSFTELVRRALSVFTAAYEREGIRPWEERFDRLVAQVRERAESFSAQETEREITSASTEARRARKRAARRH
jgi:hypothetical protein